jgi:hypothetical protein
MGDVARMPRPKVINPLNLVTIVQNSATKRRRDEAGRAGDLISQEYSRFVSVA